MNRKAYRSVHGCDSLRGNVLGAGVCLGQHHASIRTQGDDDQPAAPVPECQRSLPGLLRAAHCQACQDLRLWNTKGKAPCEEASRGWHCLHRVSNAHQRGTSKGSCCCLKIGDNPWQGSRLWDSDFWFTPFLNNGVICLYVLSILSQFI